MNKATRMNQEERSSCNRFREILQSDILNFGVRRECHISNDITKDLRQTAAEPMVVSQKWVNFTCPENTSAITFTFVVSTAISIEVACVWRPPRTARDTDCFVSTFNSSMLWVSSVGACSHVRSCPPVHRTTPHFIRFKAPSVLSLTCCEGPLSLKSGGLRMSYVFFFTRARTSLPWCCSQRADAGAQQRRVVLFVKPLFPQSSTYLRTLICRQLAGQCHWLAHQPLEIEDNCFVSDCGA